MTRLLGAIAATAAVVIGLALAFDSIFGNPGGPTWTAEFTDARGLVAGNDVRDDGAVVGRVTSIGLSRQGAALVRFQLFDRAAAPRVDAVAAIEPADLLGDTYVSLSPGIAGAPSRGPIDSSHTLNAPRLDELLDTFSPGVRDGLQLLLLEGGLALEQHGGALARTTVLLRPAVQAATGVLDELDAQNGSLAAVIAPAHAVAAQLDLRRPDVGPLLDGLARTLGATAAAAAPLGEGLAALPRTLQQLTATSDQLSSMATAATPLVARLEPMTGRLSAVLRGLSPLLRNTRTAAPTFVRAIDAARVALVAGAPGLSRLAAALPVLGAQAPGISSLMSDLDVAMPGIAQGFLVDFPDQADESGTQPLDPFADPRRAYWRGAAVFSCEAFGVPVKPGCLTEALANLGRQPPPSAAAARRLLDYLLKR